MGLRTYTLQDCCWGICKALGWDRDSADGKQSAARQGGSRRRTCLETLMTGETGKGTPGLGVLQAGCRELCRAHLSGRWPVTLSATFKWTENRAAEWKEVYFPPKHNKQNCLATSPPPSNAVPLLLLVHLTAVNIRIPPGPSFASPPFLFCTRRSVTLPRHTRSPGPVRS